MHSESTVETGQHAWRRSAQRLQFFWFQFYGHNQPGNRISFRRFYKTISCVKLSERNAWKIFSSSETLDCNPIIILE